MTKISRNLTENSSETVKSETERPKERYIYIYPEKKQKVIDYLRLINIIMKYHKIVNLLDYTPDQRSKFRTKNWVETNDNSHGNKW